jgi:hypothetical protein
VVDIFVNANGDFQITPAKLKFATSERLFRSCLAYIVTDFKSEWPRKSATSFREEPLRRRYVAHEWRRAWEHRFSDSIPSALNRFEMIDQMLELAIGLKGGLIVTNNLRQTHLGRTWRRYLRMVFANLVFRG